MLIAPIPAFAARNRRGGFTASIAATIAHDAAPASLGQLRLFGAAGPVTLLAGDLSNAPGVAGGLFSTVTTGGGVAVSFNRNGLGDGFAEGDSVLTEISPLVTDGTTTIEARVRLTVARPVSPPQLLGPIPDQVDQLT